MKKLVLSLVVLAAIATSAIAQMSIKLNSGSNKWGYGTPFVALVQQWDGSAFDVETVLHFPKSGNPGYLPRESVYGFYIQDTKNRHRYCPGIVNPSSHNHKLDPLPVGVTTHEAGGHWKPFSFKGHSVAKADSPVRLRLQFVPAVEDAKNSTLILSYAPKGKEWKEAWRYDAPANFAPNLIGLTADSYGGKYSIDPVVFDYFHVKGDGLAISDEFNGKGPDVTERRFNRRSDKKLWRIQGKKRAEFKIPVKFKTDFVQGESKFVFDRGNAAKITFSAHTSLLMNESVALKGTLVDYQGNALLTLNKTLKFNKDTETASFTLPAKLIRAC